MRSPLKTPLTTEGTPVRVPPGALKADAARPGFWDRHPRTPLLGRPAGEGMREVHFVWRPEPGLEAIVHVNSLTDRHRADITAARFVPIADDVWHVGYVLPETLVASYRVVALPHIPSDIGRERSAWKGVHEAGAPDPLSPETITNPLGGGSSVLRMPRSREHPSWSALRHGAAPQGEPLRLGTEHPAWLVRPAGQVSRLLVVFDGEVWLRMGFAHAFAHRGESALAAVLVGSGSLEQRAALLPRPDRVAQLVERQILPAVEAATGIRLGPDAVVAAGESFGGLAAAGLAVRRPDLVATAIAQSGSYHYGEGRPLRGDAVEPGDLVARLLRGRAHGHVVVQAGVEEETLAPLSRTFAETADAAGMRISHEEWSGGHDFAWWSDALFFALDGL
ncbi:enterochelin esterase domain-containing protein [Microbacterium ulmi]|uniref:DUF3327 domain-containing protein n=1 Tax=Microbacterium ulmi TaxID=179095 RepID=A0A7Y2LXA5_9MICO|nr:enterochelin esterase domain-containing protein [Microbacterium ulmi]NII71230.1 enterochelin esterase family protein [Microbacterium ulmi]NNH02535.1 DUF3327 domain-containing protein [Microbacterium ulmi]